MLDKSQIYITFLSVGLPSFFSYYLREDFTVFIATLLVVFF